MNTHEIQREPVKKTAEFSFIEEYYTSKKNEAEVILTIDYKRKIYWVNPLEKKDFVFSNSSKESGKLHLAVIKAMERAVNYAISELT